MQQPDPFNTMIPYYVFSCILQVFIIQALGGFHPQSLDDTSQKQVVI